MTHPAVGMRTHDAEHGLDEVTKRRGSQPVQVSNSISARSGHSLSERLIPRGDGNA